MNTILLSAHNPMTGPRHMGHYLSTMADWPRLQHNHELFIVIDDLIACILYPRARKEITERSFATIKEFMSTDIDLDEAHIVLTSMLPELHELSLFASLAIDNAWCKSLYRESFAGLLSSYQRRELCLPPLPSVAETIYPQLYLPSLTLGLRTHFFQGGEEMRGYLAIMDMLSNNMPCMPSAPAFMEGKDTFIIGTDGQHMASENAIYLSASESDLIRDLERVESLSILKQWAHSFDDEKLLLKIRKTEENENSLSMGRQIMLQYLKEEFAGFRESKIDNQTIVYVLEKSAIIARERIKNTLILVKKEIGIPGYL